MADTTTIDHPIRRSTSPIIGPGGRRRSARLHLWGILDGDDRSGRPAARRANPALGGRWFGIYPALVSDIKDPDGTGRVKVTLPWSPDTASDRYEMWARIATLMGGNNRGSWFIPDVNDEVLVAFEGGDPRRPYVLGGLWNGSDSPPESMDGGGQNNKKVLCSRNGVKTVSVSSSTIVSTASR